MLGRGPARFLPVVALVLFGGYLVAGQLSGEERQAPAQRTQSATTFQKACIAEAAVAGGDAAKAVQIFQDELHEPLHVLAASAAQRDRGRAADLLEAKQRVERDVEQGVDPSAEDLKLLADAVSRAVEVVDRRDPGRCP